MTMAVGSRKLEVDVGVPVGKNGAAGGGPLELVVNFVLAKLVAWLDPADILLTLAYS